MKTNSISKKEKVPSLLGTLLCSLATALLIAYAPFANAHEPTNLALKKQELIRYHDSGNYEKDINSTVTQALHYLQHYLHNNHSNKKPAVVLDIDETSLSNYPNMLKLNFGGTYEEITQAEDLGNDPVIVPTLKLYRYAKAHHIAVFFITGRHEFERASTIENLKHAGYSNWDGLILRSEREDKLPATIYKVAARQRLVNKGYNIIMNMGDQESDLRGAYTGKNFKLPNPYYFIA